MKNLKIKLSLLFIFVLVSFVTFQIQNNNKNSSIDLILKNDIKNLNVHYNFILDNFSEASNHASKLIQNNKNIIEIIKKSNNANWFEKKELREELYKETYKLYRTFRQKRSITNLHFVSPDNKSFLRVHKKLKHSDDLTGISDIFTHVNQTHQPNNGFEIGRIKNSFNYVYPLFDEKNNYIGSFSLGFDSKYLQDILTEKLNTYTHILINKNAFDNIIYKNYGYKVSIENDQFMYIPNYIVDNNGKQIDINYDLKDIKDDIKVKMSNNEEFAFNFIDKENSFIVAFIPIKSFNNNKPIAYISSYIKKDEISEILHSFQFNFLISILLLVIIFYFLYSSLVRKKLLKEEVKSQTKKIEQQKESLALINTDLETQVLTRIGEIYALNEEIKDTQKEVVFTMGAIAESRSKETANHVKRVAEYSKILALHYGLGQEKAEILKEASPMHDIGKVGIPDSILKKDGKLTKDEYEHMKKHTTIGYNLLKHSNRELLQTAAIVSHEHHEKWDGSGYPRGLKGEKINIYGRITAIADVFDALSCKRVYKSAWTDEDIFKLFKEESGKHFDPKLIEIFFENINEFLEVREKLKDTI